MPSFDDPRNSMIHNVYWDHTSLFDSLSVSIEAPHSLPDDLPFYQVLPLSVKIPQDELEKVNIYLDDTIGIAPDINNNAV
jgi:hypothetical protein